MCAGDGSDEPREDEFRANAVDCLRHGTLLRLRFSSGVGPSGQRSESEHVETEIETNNRHTFSGRVNQGAKSRNVRSVLKVHC